MLARRWAHPSHKDKSVARVGTRRAICPDDHRLLVEAEAAIDDERLASDEMRPGGEEEDGLSDVVRIAIAAHGSFGGEAGGL